MIEKYKLDTKGKTELSVEKEQEIARELVGQIIPHKGHTMFEINEETGEIQKATYIDKGVFIFGKKNHREVLIREGFFYTSALKKETALRKWKIRDNGSKILGDSEIKLF